MTRQLKLPSCFPPRYKYRFASGLPTAFNYRVIHFAYLLIYQLSTDGNWQCYLPDTVMTLEAWQETLNSIKSPYKLVKAPEQIAYTVSDVLKLAYLQWQQKQEGSWSEVIPFYGQHPV